MPKPKQSGLGKGLDAIFFDNTAGYDNSGGGSELLRVSSVAPRADQPRTVFDEESLDALADSIREHGMLQPIVVRPAENGYYTIIAGERRWRAAMKAGLTEIPARVMDADEKTAYQLAMIENLMREDLDPFEEAASFRRLLDDYGMKQEEIGALIGRSVPYISNALRLLRLPETVAGLVRSGEITAGHARALLGIEGGEYEMTEAAARVADTGMSVRETEAYVKHLNAAAAQAREKEDRPEAPPPVDYAALLAGKITREYGRRVTLKETKRRKTIQIEYRDEDELQEIISQLIGHELRED